MTVMSGAAGDEEIAAAIRSGDHRRALALCAREHARALGQLCMALLGSQGEAEDVVQETLLDAHAAFASWRAEGSLRAWLCGIARRKCARQLEQRARRTARLRLVHDGRAGSEGEELVMLRERAERARHALESVRPTEREALVLRYGSGLSFREVAEACGIDEAAARKRVSRALGKLRLAMSEEK
ncbi:MAG: RNA polymerase sigma factor [Polyangiaceae bacterium]|nr:RNA polymerase sigma factor [Polyangiaceae bacterium]